MNHKNFFYDKMLEQTGSHDNLRARVRPNDCPKKAALVDEIINRFDAEKSRSSPDEVESTLTAIESIKDCSRSSEIRALSVADGLEVGGLNPSGSAHNEPSREP